MFSKATVKREKKMLGKKEYLKTMLLQKSIKIINKKKGKQNRR